MFDVIREPVALSVCIKCSCRAVCDQAEIGAEQAHQFRCEQGQHESLEGGTAFKASSGKGRETARRREPGCRG